MKVFSQDYLDEIVLQARVSGRLRQHKNIHSDYSDPCQRLFNAIEPDSYIRPHRHGLCPRDETMIAIRGLLALLLFDELGNVVEIVRLGADAEESACAIGVEVPAKQWHTVLALKPGSVLLEVKAGPFDPSFPKEFAAWSPEEGTEQARLYLQRLRYAVGMT